ncbi:succinate-semialdehyde dehydrogenase [Klebsiella variicola]|uniref:Succinate-semialdehyde dehydrogenase n=1 Tax=Klebsiella variicola TaxID=244366 RepID=A0A7H4MJW4_KLEVA|nr:succinate-semialdehyde dehydrogenase [Klebsiella variicola]
MGDPRDEQNYVGPMARFDLRDELHQQVTATLDEGATLLLGAEKIEGAGNYYAPTVLGNVTAGMTGFRQELFGPVATLTTARDADHALALANDSEFGLSATVYTTDEGAGPALRPRAGVRRRLPQRLLRQRRPRGLRRREEEWFWSRAVAFWSARVL